LDQLVLTPDAEDDSVEVVGWLEAAWDPAPLRIVLGMNENLIPSRPMLEPLVPDSIRERLGLDSQARRAARDAWLVEVLESSRSHSAKVEYIVPRQNVDGDRLLPSRLVLPKVESSLTRLPRLLSSSCDLQMRPRRATRREVADSQGAAFPLLPGALPELKRVSVTDFRVWLDSPVKFVLKKMKLAETVDPWRAELDAMRFGNLVHSAFEAWGREEAANGPTTSLKAIQEGFQHHLESCVNDRFGKARPAALKLQIEIARHRMQAFAEVQHRLAQEEWCVEYVELHFTDRDVPNAIDPLRRSAAPDLIVTGKIDRVDRHPSGRRRAIDYKVVNSSDLSKKKAEASHYQVRKS
ncbi:MAG: PD-(D/E)XK nuclease family protein, partial [Planctomycetota bacterium]|nr:PD-(D/E)XK nuclease family protein [Planctomycetota bacterium]